jgi:hypothetical protein
MGGARRRKFATSVAGLGTHLAIVVGGLAVRLIDWMEIPSMQDTHAKVLFLLEVLIRVQAVPATTSWKLEHDGPPAIYTRPREDSTSTLAMPQPKTVIKIVRVHTDPKTPILHAPFRFSISRNFVRNVARYTA